MQDKIEKTTYMATNMRVVSSMPVVSPYMMRVDSSMVPCIKRPDMTDMTEKEYERISFMRADSSMPEPWIVGAQVPRQENNFNISSESEREKYLKKLRKEMEDKDKKRYGIKKYNYE
jgi:hypothetical protein